MSNGLKRTFWIVPLVLVAILAALWLARARLAGEVAQRYFRDHNIASDISFGRLGLSGVTGRIILGPADAPDFSAESVEVDFDPLQFTPRIVEVRLVNPVVRARIGSDGKLTLGSLQAWLDSLPASEGESPYVSADLVVSLSHLRALLATPAGPLELGGDVKVKHSDLVSADLAARPTILSWQGTAIRLAGAGLRLEEKPSGHAATAHFEGSVSRAGLQATDVTAQLAAPGLRWDLNAKTFAAPSVTAQIKMASLQSGVTATNPSVDLAVKDLRGTFAGAVTADITARAGADFAFDVTKIPVLTRDRRMTQALQGNLKHLDITLSAAVTRQDGQLELALKAPAIISGARGGSVRLASLSLKSTPAGLEAAFDAALSGPSLPAISLRAKNLRLQGGGLTLSLATRARFDFDMMRGADVSANGTASLKQGVFGFAFNGCSPATLKQFLPGGLNLARTVKATICAAPGQKAFTADASGWRFSVQARNAAMVVPLGDVQFSGASGRIAFSGTGAQMGGKVTVTAARMSDHAPAPRFEPLTGTGEVLLKDWVWHGTFAAADKNGTALGKAGFSHVMATGEGQMTIDAPHLEFAQGKLQPDMLSPLLGKLSQVHGNASFDGVIAWSHDGLTSHGNLAVDKLDFLTPLGTAHAVNAKIALSSLLPPVTAPGQHIEISRIDWTLPLSGIAVDFSFGGNTLKLNSLTTSIADGKVKLGTIAINLAAPGKVEGAASLGSISLAPLVAASNLGEKIKLEGKITGTVPFSYGPEGFRIVSGRVAADGPGRISLNRSVWNEGGAGPPNVVQDLAYQALENLAFDALSADINSVPGGRLQVLFHIKGHSDPPQPQQAEIAVGDLLDGTVLQKPIKLTSGTPIDLTLDTSLNFDELLKSYSEAWSKTLGQP